MDEFRPSPLDYFMGVVWLIIFVCLIYLAFEYFCGKVSLFDPGSQIGIGVGGFIGLIGFFLGYWNGISCIATTLFGACIGSGMYRFNERPNVQMYRAYGRNRLRAIQ